MSTSRNSWNSALAWIAGSTTVVVAVIAITIWFWHASNSPEASEGKATITGDFSLVDHRGKPVTDEDFAGRWQLVFFGFTNCADICPTTLGTMSVVMADLGADAQAVQPLFITVDPERDTPEVLATYLEAFDPRIVGLTGSPEQIEAAAQSFRTTYDRIPQQHAPDDYTMFHQGYLFLMDPEGNFDRVFGQPVVAEEVVAEIRERL